MTIEGDAFGKIYEYFLGKFAMAEGQKGGEFFTPTSIVKLIVEIIEPYHGRIFDPACGSGGMFVQSAAFVEHHKKSINEIAIYGQEKVAETIRLCKMNLAVQWACPTFTKPSATFTRARHPAPCFANGRPATTETPPVAQQQPSVRPSLNAMSQTNTALAVSSASTTISTTPGAAFPSRTITIVMPPIEPGLGRIPGSSRFRDKDRY